MRVVLVTKEMRAAVEKYPELVLWPYDQIIGLDGIDAVGAFVQCFGGSSVYVPSLRSIFRECLLAAARDDLTDGKSFGYSQRHFRRIL